MNYSKKIILILSLPLVVLIMIASCIGLFSNDFYISETSNWKIQSISQDAIDLFLVSPALLLTTLFAQKHKTVFLLWGGVNLYVGYTYAIYCFDVHFNNLFILYCLSLGLSFYAFLYFLFSLQNRIISKEFLQKALMKTIATYFIAIAILFYFLWLSEIVQAINNSESLRNLKDLGLPTNPVHVLDLSIILPAIFIIGVLIFKKRSVGFLLAPAVLSFFVLLDITIAVIDITISLLRNQSNYTVAGLVIAFALFSLILLKKMLNLKDGSVVE